MSQTDQKQKMTLADYAAEHYPLTCEKTIEHDGTEIVTTLKRIGLEELLAVEGLSDMLDRAAEEETDFEGTAASEWEDTAKQLPVMERVILLGTTETEETIHVLPIQLKTKLFREVFDFQQLGGSTFPAAD